MEMEKSKVLIQFLLFFRQFGDVFFFLCARRLRGYTATVGTFFDHLAVLAPPQCTLFNIVFICFQGCQNSEGD